MKINKVCDSCSSRNVLWKYLISISFRNTHLIVLWFIAHIYNWWWFSRKVVSDSSSPPGSSVCGDSPGNNTGVGRHALLQGIFPNQGYNLVSCIAGRFFTSQPPGKAPQNMECFMNSHEEFLNFSKLSKNKDLCSYPTSTYHWPQIMNP